jgi:hypothetical protein
MMYYFFHSKIEHIIYSIINHLPVQVLIYDKSNYEDYFHVITGDNIEENTLSKILKIGSNDDFFYYEKDILI